MSGFNIRLAEPKYISCEAILTEGRGNGKESSKRPGNDISLLLTGLI